MRGEIKTKCKLNGKLDTDFKDEQLMRVKNAPPTDTFVRDDSLSFNGSSDIAMEL